MNAASPRHRLDAAIAIDRGELRLSLRLRIEDSCFALVRDCQGPRARPVVQSIGNDGALVWFGQVRVPDGLLSAAPILPRGERIDPERGWQRTLSLGRRLTETAIARAAALEVERVPVLRVLAGVQVVPVAAVAATHDARTDSHGIGLVEPVIAAWAWAELPAPSTIARAVLPDPLPRGIMSTVDHLLPVELRRLRSRSP
ncbi:MAG: hypothetical protein IPH07_34415 [Deltaproteobacteria bacterium]|nr:hypothetical protein [Deltaproteobacteria bacterium]MBK8235274.1 hypothetical protein [Deltaproteobacteria bacterium]MBK8716407.1 hypothetical protein [Deltaproteobacteria bacterium]MBP7287872.1 hypothetical protein [Nannocystaceae bacterium]